METGTLALFVLGLLLLIGGADIMVRAASRLATALGVSKLVIGLTVVAFGTGSPELAVALGAAFTGEVDIAVGNVVGSNIFNVLFVLGLSAAIVPLVVANQLVRIDVPIMVAASLLLLLMALDQRIARWEGALLFGGIVMYTTMLFRNRKRELSDDGPEAVDAVARPPALRERRTRWLPPVIMIGLGLTLLVVGARWLVAGAVGIAHALGVSQLVIGLTIVAAGTSMPEVATSVVAGIRGQRDIAIGNVVGSNIYNILLVLGLAALVAPAGIDVAPDAISFDIPVMIAVAVVCVPIFLAGRMLRRWAGFLFLGYWVAYNLYIVLSASEHGALHAFNRIMTFFVIPMSVLTIGIVSLHELRKRAAARAHGGSGEGPAV